MKIDDTVETAACDSRVRCQQATRGQFAVALLVRRTVRVGCGPSVLLRASSTYSWYCRGRLRSARGWQATPRCSVPTKLSSHPAWRLCVRSPPHQPLYRAAHHLIEKGFSRARSLSTLPSLPPSLARSLCLPSLARPWNRCDSLWLGRAWRLADRAHREDAGKPCLAVSLFSGTV